MFEDDLKNSGLSDGDMNMSDIFGQVGGAASDRLAGLRSAKKTKQVKKKNTRARVTVAHKKKKAAQDAEAEAKAEEGGSAVIFNTGDDHNSYVPDITTGKIVKKKADP